MDLAKGKSWNRLQILTVQLMKEACCTRKYTAMLYIATEISSKLKTQIKEPELSITLQMHKKESELSHYFCYIYLSRNA